MQVETQPINIADVPFDMPAEPVFDPNTPKKFADMVDKTDKVSWHRMRDMSCPHRLKM